MVPGPAVYGLVDASAGWVTRRLRALAACMALTRPVRDGFLFPADAAFYALCTGSVVELQRAARRVIEHLGIPCDTVAVAFRAGLAGAACIERDGGAWYIEIDPRFRGDAHALGAILAHECCHILVAERRVPRFDTAVDEVHVDLAAMLCGLGALTLNGINTRTAVQDDRVVTEHRAFGYLPAPLLCHAYAYVAGALGLGARRAVAPLRHAATRSRVAWAVALRSAASALGPAMRRPAVLGYRDHGSHVVVSCARAACGQRLRIPAGRRGTARCPACGKANGFDGRACRVRVLTQPEPMPHAALPSNTRAARAWRALGRLPVSQKLALAAVAVALCIPALLAAHAYQKRTPVGGACRAHTDCRSDLCVRVSDRPVLAPDVAADPLVGRAMQGLYRGLDPLAPGRTDLRMVTTREAYCSVECSRDADCPEGFVCSQAQRFQSLLANVNLVHGTGRSVQMCARRATDRAGAGAR